jgi:hypothetical protein
VRSHVGDRLAERRLSGGADLFAGGRRLHVIDPLEDVVVVVVEGRRGEVDEHLGAVRVARGAGAESAGERERRVVGQEARTVDGPAGQRARGRAIADVVDHLGVAEHAVAQRGATVLAVVARVALDVRVAKADSSVQVSEDRALIPVANAERGMARERRRAHRVGHAGVASLGLRESRERELDLAEGRDHDLQRFFGLEHAAVVTQAVAVEVTAGMLRAAVAARERAARKLDGVGAGRRGSPNIVTQRLDAANA